ncbi:MAG: hypothetical protein IPI01_10515 [Ignavibacteriae bacterium]|nr:hypothetical protein [Ignavibacteriota bacterium]
MCVGSSRRTSSTRSRPWTHCDAHGPTTAFKIGEKAADPLTMYLPDIYTVSANLAGVPAISVPCGNADGLPVGMQFIA